MRRDRMSSVIVMWQDACQRRIDSLLASKCRDAQVLWDSCVEKPTRLADIQRTTSLTLKTVNNTRSQSLGNPVLLQIILFGCLAFLSLRTGFQKFWDLVLFTVLSVNDVVRCMSARRVGFSTHESQSTWASLHLLVRSESILLRQTSCHITMTLDILSRLMTSPSCPLHPSTLNFSSEKAFLSANSIHRLMPKWAPYHFLYFKTFLFLTFPLHLSLLFLFVFFTSILTPISCK